MAASEEGGVLLMTDLNYAEVKYAILKKHGPSAWGEVERVLDGLPVRFVSISRVLADLAADYKARFRISLADAFAAALAKEQQAELLTGDPEFQALEGETQIRWLSEPRKGN